MARARVAIAAAGGREAAATIQTRVPFQCLEVPLASRGIRTSIDKVYADEIGISDAQAKPAPVRTPALGGGGGEPDYLATTRSTEYPESLVAAPESGHRCIYDGTT
eukprot:COSAG02_NODE_107_length_36312_cov_45.037942_22_plen_106_part_00